VRDGSAQRAQTAICTWEFYSPTPAGELGVGVGDETGFYYVAQAALEHVNLLSLPPEC
jgi:hypothetical protein